MGTGNSFRFAAFNIWGDFFGNPTHERDLDHAAILLGHNPDFIGLQEMTPNFWKSRLVDALAEEFVGSREDMEQDVHSVIGKLRAIGAIDE